MRALHIRPLFEFLVHVKIVDRPTHHPFPRAIHYGVYRQQCNNNNYVALLFHKTFRLQSCRLFVERKILPWAEDIPEFQLVPQKKYYC